LPEIKTLLAQLGKTPFIKKEKPTPFDEAVSLIWYLENVFYKTAGEMAFYIQDTIYNGEHPAHPVMSFGFWPGGDRDGNPFVTTDITLDVAGRLRTSILKCYYNDIRRMRRKLTFPGVEPLVMEIEQKLYRSVFYSQGELYIELEELKTLLNEIKNRVVEHHQSLYLDEIEKLINKVNLFGFHFATLDIRQNSRIHDKVVQAVLSNLDSQNSTALANDCRDLDEKAKLNALLSLKGNINTEDFNDDNTRLTLESILAMRTIQERNGEQGANRYIISNNENAHNVLELLTLFELLGWDKPSVDIVPLFETVDDLKEAGEAMRKLYENERYAAHLKARGNKQTIMLGFSDGTKDGGYLMANWSIYTAKENLTAVAREYGIKVIF